MKTQLLTILLLTITTLCQAQNPILWGYTSAGGINNIGTIFNYNTATSTETDKYDFAGSPNDGGSPISILNKAYNGLLYGLTGGAGAYHGGTIFSYNISTSIESVLYNFGSGTDGINPRGYLLLATDSLFYGMTQNGGIYHAGIFFSYNISIGKETDLHDFGSGIDGYNPLGSLVQANNGLLYGVVGNGGAYSGGIVFSYDITTGNYTDVHDFGNGNDGEYPEGSLIQVGDSLLYGVTSGGGIYKAGTIFSYNILTNAETVLYDFGNSTNGTNPVYDKLLEASDSLLYGLTQSGGVYNEGIIFNYNIKTRVETNIYDFGNGTNGKEPVASLIQASNGLLYGMTQEGGTNGGISGDGIIFSYSITSGIETDIHDFGNGTDGKTPLGSLIEVDTATIYVATVQAICKGNSVTLKASGATSYTWQPATGLSATTGDSVIASPTATTTYTITGVGANQTTVTVTVAPNPTISVNTPAPVCAGTGATLNANGSVKYTWSPAINLSSATDSVVTATPTITTTYTVVGSNNEGCADTTTTVVTINAKPILNVPTPPTICNGSTDTLTVSGALAYVWSPSVGLSATTGSSVIANPTVNSTYTIVGVNSNGCADTTSVTVGVSPVLALIITVPAPICSGGTDTLTVSGANTYTWSPSVGLSSTTGSTIIANPTATTTYIITGNSLAGCTGSGVVIVAINPTPVITVSPNPASFCLGSGTVLIASGGTNYTWSPSTNLSATTGDTVTANPTTTTTYTVTGTDANGCMAADTDVVAVIPLPNKPTITVSVTGDTLISSATQGNQWYRNDTLITGATNQYLIITGQTTGSYTVEVINPANGCSATSDSLITSSVNQISVISKQLSIYPNPFNNNIFITINTSTQNVIDWSFILTDVLGRILFTKPSLGYSNEIDLSNLSSGVYFITIINKTQRAVYPVVKQN